MVVPAMIVTPAPGAHGGDGERVARAFGFAVADVLDLSQSLNPVAQDPRPVVARHLDAVGRYPDPTRARDALAAAMGVAPDRLLLTNGGAQAIALVARELGGTVREPEFSLHPRDGGPLWRSNPHSPSGLLAAPEDRAAVWDEAFYPMATGTWSRGDLDSVVVGSLTKLFACPGLRIGYVLGDAEFVARCQRHQPLWSLNALAAAAVGDLLDGLDLAYVHDTIGELRRELGAVFERHHMLVSPSDANWVLVAEPDLRARLAPYGIVVRDCSSFGLPGVARVAVPDRAGLARLDRALQDLGDGRPATANPRVDGRDYSDEEKDVT